MLRLWQNLSPMLLSPDSVAYPIEGTRDRGGWGEDAADQMAKGGACPQELWPEGDLSPKKADPNWEEAALNHVLLKWIYVDSWEKQITLAIRDIPVAIPLMWWGHLVCQTGPHLDDKGNVGIWIDNSWGDDWGEDGSAVLDEESGYASSGAFAPIAQTYFQTPDAM